MKKNIYHYRGFDGIDASLETSLFEYGLIWKKEKKDYKFIYGFANNCSEYYLFDYATIPITTNIADEYNFADLNAVANFVGMKLDEWLNSALPNKIFDLIAYYGVESIFGSSYNPFMINH